MDFIWKPDHFRIDPSRPLYEQFVEQLRADIARGVLAPGIRLPSVRELAATIRVNPTTVMKTYQELERSQLIVTYRGQGTFVTKDEKVIRESKRAIAREAVRKLRETAESLDLTVEQLLELAQVKEE
ncbi:GntR family transcriptional regulator [Paenibacillus doosanensis]|uniref:HTH-type transcriptional repressor YtrA n=1 Tax=Paenibacillus konkukensis TaxID=2020716 RepID=A0ABY4RV27_9BACL|nr:MULTISPECIES: GntR family transcriptional regulator [Paenibacillus]MCS7458983.1 GntR family transcriptional regulator [Paenibacillus doosanensis]UQZ86484.1 HTH-type transcriptional repressor YtrA [Paenibacillus konkukensis]